MKAKDKSEEDEEERDMYEELLTHAELQGNLNKINRLFALLLFNYLPTY